MKTRFSLAVAVLLFGLAQTAVAQNAASPPAAQALRFQYTAGKPLTYAMTTQVKIVMDMKVGGEPVKTKTDSTLRYKLTLTPKAEKSPGVTTCAVSASDVEQDLEVAGPAGETVVKIRGARVTGTLNGNETIDTEKGVGTEQANQYKTNLAGLSLGGELDLDGSGRIKDFRGEPAFVEFWKQVTETSVGIFGIVLAETPVAVGGSWKEDMAVRKMGQVLLDKDGLKTTVTFTRQPDASSDAARPVAVIKLSAPFDLKDLVGYIPQGSEKSGWTSPLPPHDARDRPLRASTRRPHRQRHEDRRRRHDDRQDRRAGHEHGHPNPVHLGAETPAGEQNPVAATAARR